MSKFDFTVDCCRARNMYKYLIVYEYNYYFHFECHNLSENVLNEIEALLKKKVEHRFEFDEYDSHKLYMYIGDHKVEFQSDLYCKCVSMPAVINTMELTDLDEIKRAYKDLAKEYNHLKSELIDRFKC